MISDLNGEKNAGRFFEKELQKTSQEKFRTEKIIKEKVINCMSNGKNMIIHLIVGLTKKTLNEIPSYKISQYFPNPFTSFGGNTNVKVDLSNYATKTNLASLKTTLIN